MVNSPLLLDEPCDGLDIANRKKIMDVLNLIGRHSGIDPLYIPHHEEKMLPCITHVLKMDTGMVQDPYIFPEPRNLVFDG